MSEDEVLFFNDRRLVEGNPKGRTRDRGNEGGMYYDAGIAHDDGGEVPIRASKGGSRSRINQVLAEARASVQRNNNNNDEEEEEITPLRPSLKVITYSCPSYYSFTNIITYTGSIKTLYTC